MQVTEKYLIMVTLNNNNKFYKMIPNGNSTFKVVYGRVGNAGVEQVYPLAKWDSIYNSKIAKGYVDQTAIMNVAEQDNAPTEMEEITNESVRYIVERLQMMAKQTINRNYRLSSTQVTPEMVKEAEQLLKLLAEQDEKLAFNKILLRLFETIPRKMSNVISFTARKDSEMGSILQRESDLLDVLKGQIQTADTMQKAEQTTKKINLLDSLGLKMEECSPKEVEKVKNLMDPETAGRFCKAWKVCNKKTEGAFRRYCKEENIEETKLLFHGSRSENWWSIINTGLKLNPSNVAINGKMFGYGIYFAPKAKKSTGYTSHHNGHWVGGNSNCGYMGIYEIAYGKPHDVHQWGGNYGNFTEADMKRLGTNCLHAHAGVSLANDEVIVYNEAAATIRYLIEFV